MEGGNPSRNGTTVGVAAAVEGVPTFALEYWGGTCNLVHNEATPQVPLGAAGLTKYDNLKQQLLSGGRLTSLSLCSDFFHDDSIRAPYFDQLQNALTRQQPYDGRLTIGGNLPRYTVCTRWMPLNERIILTSNPFVQSLSCRQTRG